MAYLSSEKKKVTTATFAQMKAAGEKVSMLTSYDFTLAGMVDEAGIDSILVGDSASNIMQGNETTLPITVDEMIVYARSVVRAAKHALVLVDMPFGSYQGDPYEAYRNAVHIMKETGADALKLEGGEEILPAIKLLINGGIPVCAHLGLTPQSVNKFGGYGLRAKGEAEAEKLLHDAHLLDEAGCFAMVLEKVPADLAARVTCEVSCVTIGIGAGHKTDGQVLVLHDMLGMNQGFQPKFLRHFAELHNPIIDAVKSYHEAVKQVTFPNNEEQY